MKKLNVNLMALSVFAVTLFSCNNETEMMTQERKIDPVEQKILVFKQKLESNKKSGEIIDIDSVVWYIEAALNYTYCVMETSDVINIDSTFVTIPVSGNGKINFGNIIRAYHQFENDLNDIIDNTNGVNKNMLVTDISYIENDNKSTETVFKLTTIVTGEINNDGIELKIDFGDTDYWYPVEGDGKCGNYTGQETGKDLATQISYKANRNARPRQYSYSTDVVTVNVAGTSWFWQGNRTDCIEPSGCNNWLNKAEEFAEVLNVQIPDLTIVNYDIYSRLASGSFYTHGGQYTYGIWHRGEAIHD